MSIASGVGPSAGAEASSTSYRLFLGDTDGAIKSFEAPQPSDIPEDAGSSEGQQSTALPKPVGLVKGPGAKKAPAPAPETDGERAVQRMASGVLNGVGWVVSCLSRICPADASCLRTVVVASASPSPFYRSRSPGAMPQSTSLLHLSAHRLIRRRRHLMRLAPRRANRRRRPLSSPRSATRR